MGNTTWIATCAFGLEALVARELKQLGYADLHVANGKVTFLADDEAIARCNIQLRCAERVLLQMGQFRATTFDQLFEQTRSLPWHDMIPEDACFPVEGKSIKSQLYSVSDCQAIVKKAIVEKMKQRYRRSWFDETGPRYTIEVALLDDIATLTIDTSGRGLHKRGYRKDQTAAPLKETLAAAMVLLSRWKPDRPFIDPFCGSGTIPIEAAMIGSNTAPGLGRSFAAEAWSKYSAKLWQMARQEAYDQVRMQEKTGILGCDIDPAALRIAQMNASLAGVKGKISFERKDALQLSSRYQYGYLICNPPYGERLATTKEVEALYRQMGQAFTRLDTWSLYILTSHPGLEKFMGRKADKRRKLFNGRIPCTYYQFFGPRPSLLRGPFAPMEEQ